MNKSVREVEWGHSDHIQALIQCATEPIVFRGLIADWPAVSAARKSISHAAEYLLQFYDGKPVTAAIGEPSTQGRVFYNQDFTGFNYSSQRVSLNAVLHEIQQHQYDLAPPMIYVASTSVDEWLPGFNTQNSLNIPEIEPLVSIWLGNKSRIAAHYDVPDNIACAVAGRRRFTLFPPDQIANLYPGPLDFAPGGQSISLVNFHQPDFKKHPRFKHALDNAVSTELMPGDALFIPSMWWHHVEGLESFNALVNYWWRKSPAYMSTPADTLAHALLTIRDLPKEQKQAWQGIFEHYIFNSDTHTNEHIPDQASGFLGKLDVNLARKIRAYLLNKLNR